MFDPLQNPVLPPPTSLLTIDSSKMVLLLWFYVFACYLTISYSDLDDRGGLVQWLASRTTDKGVPGSRPGCVAVRCGLEQVTFTPCLVLVKPWKPWTLY